MCPVVTHMNSVRDTNSEPGLPVVILDPSPHKNSPNLAIFEINESSDFNPRFYRLRRLCALYFLPSRNKTRVTQFHVRSRLTSENRFSLSQLKTNQRGLSRGVSQSSYGVEIKL